MDMGSKGRNKTVKVRSAYTRDAIDACANTDSVELEKLTYLFLDSECLFYVAVSRTKCTKPNQIFL